MKIFKLTFLSVLAIGFISQFYGCGISDKATSESTTLPTSEPVISVPDGTYYVSTIPAGESIPARTVCASDNSRPLLSSSVATTANIGQLVKFNELTANFMAVTISGNIITKTWSRDANLSSIFPGANTAFPSGEATCSASWVGLIANNLDGTFQEQGSYIVQRTPTDCEFEVHNYATAGASVATGAWVPNNSFSTIFTTTTSTTKQGAWDVTNVGNVYTLTMPASVAATQTGYTCADGTNIVKMIWTKI